MIPQYGKCKKKKSSFFFLKSGPHDMEKTAEKELYKLIWHSFYQCKNLPWKPEKQFWIAF